jgi:type VI secretion system protein ImpK
MTPATHRNPDNLAMALQEVFTATVRIRAKRQPVTDSEAFRGQIREALRGAEQQARQRGYSDDEARLAIFAVVAFLDETILRSGLQAFSRWPGKPLQEEIFGRNVAGETFFQNLENLLRAPDSPNIADLLEVYDLCLLLGYQGRYTLGGRGELESMKRAIATKIERIRGPEPLAPEWQPQAGSAPAVAGDPLVRTLLWTACGCAVVALVLFVIFRITLSWGVSTVQTLSTQSSATQSRSL